MRTSTSTRPMALPANNSINHPHQTHSEIGSSDCSECDSEGMSDVARK
jgi:hypothetical protein